MSMFSKATSSIVRQIEDEWDGSLIHVTRLNDSYKLVPMAVVAKRNRFWFWQKPKYRPSDFTLGDLLLGDATLDPVLSESYFLSCQLKFVDSVRAEVSAKASDVNIDLAGSGSSKLKLSFGNLRKQQVNVRKLMNDCSDRLVDMGHRLVQQMQKHNEVLAVLKERVLTTTPCALTETHKKQGSCGGALNLMGMLGRTVEINVRESSTREMDSDISLEIPAETVIAYSLIELEIKKDGHFELCLQPSTSGGFEEDSGTSSPSNDALDNMCEVDGIALSDIRIPGGAPLSALNSELQKLEGYLCLLAELPERRDLFQMLKESLRDRDTLALLENTLEQLCREEVSEFQPLGSNGPAPAALLELLLSLAPAHQSENGDSDPPPPHHLMALHLLVSAMEALPDETLSSLAECSPETLQAIDELICQLRGSDHPLPANSVPIIGLEEDAWMFSERLLRSSRVSLKRETDGGLWAETGSEAGQLPLVLCITLRGLSSLCHGE